MYDATVEHMYKVKYGTIKRQYGEGLFGRVHIVYYVFSNIVTKAV